MKEVQTSPKDNLERSTKRNLYFTIYDLLKLGFNPSKICKRLDIRKQRLQYHLTTLKREGYIQKRGYGVWEITEKEVQKEVQKITPVGMKRSTNLETDKVRGHAFMFTLKLPSKLRKWNRREEILEKMGIDFKPLILGTSTGQKLDFKGRKVWLMNKSIVIYEKSSYLADTAQKAKDYALADLISLVKSLERKLHANLSFGGKYKFKVSRQHYALIKNALARQYDREGKKLQVYNSSGLWFLIDNSYNLHEAETVHSKTAVSDNQKVQDFFNGIKDLDGFTPSFIVTSLGKAVEQIGQHGENLNNYMVHLKAHVQSVKDLGAGVNKQNMIFERITKVLERLEK